MFSYREINCLVLLSHFSAKDDVNDSKSRLISCDTKSINLNEFSYFNKLTYLD